MVGFYEIPNKNIIPIMEILQGEKFYSLDSWKRSR
jgi:hypothetical protein